MMMWPTFCGCSGTCLLRFHMLHFFGYQGSLSSKLDLSCVSLYLQLLAALLLPQVMSVLKQPTSYAEQRHNCSYATQHRWRSKQETGKSTVQWVPRLRHSYVEESVLHCRASGSC